MTRIMPENDICPMTTLNSNGLTTDDPNPEEELPMDVPDSNEHAEAQATAAAPTSDPAVTPAAAVAAGDAKSTTEKETEEIILEPYVFPASRRGRRNNRKGSIPNKQNWISPTAAALTSDFRVFFTIKAQDDGNLSRIDSIRANKEIERKLGGKPYKISETRTGELTMELRSGAQCRLAPTITSLADIPVTVGEHDRLNERKGTIFYANHFNYSDQQLLEELNQFGVTNIYRTKRKQNNILLPTSIYILTFRCDLPEHVNIGWTRCSVRTYLPKPRRCFKCQGYGHGANTCRKTIGTCYNCAQQVHELPCSRPAVCANCGDGHPAGAPNCRTYKMEAEILATQARDRIPLGEARRIVRGRYVQPNTSYAKAAQRHPGENNAPPAHRERKSMADGSTQTDCNINIALMAPTSAAKTQPTASTTTTKTHKNTFTCKSNPNDVVKTIPGRKRQKSPSPPPENAVKPKTARKPSLKSHAEEPQAKRPNATAAVRRSSLSETTRRPSVNQPHGQSGTTDTTKRTTTSNRSDTSAQHNFEGTTPNRNSATTKYPVPSYAPTKLPPTTVINTYTWDQRNKPQDPHR